MQEAFNAVKKLVQDFRAQESYYLSPDYQESEARTDFIDKFFIALGWDVHHQHQKNPYEQEVKIEKEVKTALAQRRADYAFFVAPNFRDPRFYVEAKKPSKNLKNAPDYHQTTRYGWNKGTPIAVLTDFEEFHVLDCRYKPDVDTALQRAIKTFSYKDYTNEDKFKEIYYLFSREAVADGSLEKFAATLPKPKGKARQRALFKGGYQPVDEAFLSELDGYRETLAKAFKKSNPKLESDELTEIVQRTIDRLVFIRFLEDKQIEDTQMIAYRSKSQKGGPSAWAAFLAECRRLEPKYNGLVFRTHPIIDKPDFTPPDDTDFADICDELADETSPYNFELIPIEILGSIYERFLGKVVRATDKQAKVEDKPEVRKAGGVYYTPQYIVRYIVENTVGKLLYEEAETGREEKTGRELSSRPTSESPLLLGEGKGEVSSVKKSETGRELRSRPTFGSGVGTPSQQDGRKFKLTPDQVAKLSFADIACGSGSFLIEVYNELIRYHELYYTQHPDKAKKGDTETRDGKMILSLKKRQEILTNNIYGVDIDYQATEVTQLSLYLKLLEDVTLSQTHLFKEKILPDLRNNIVCGNSLIGRDILEGDLFESDELKKLKPMDFANVFPGVMQRGGFDAVVGNPPYIGFHGFEEIKGYLKKRYLSAEGKFDIYLPFIERGLQLLNEKKELSFICPANFTKRGHGENLREYLRKNISIEQICNFEDIQIFEGVTNYTGIFVFRNEKPQTNHKILYKRRRLDDPGFYILQSQLSSEAWVFRDETTTSVIKRIESQQVKTLEKLVSGISEGIVTGQNDVFLISIEEAKRLKLEKEIIKPCIRGSEVRKYHLDKFKQIVIYPYTLKNNKTISLAEKELSKFKNAYSYLKSRRKDLSGRGYFEKSSKDWYELWNQRDLRVLSSNKILVAELSNTNRFMIADSSLFYGDTVCGITILPNVKEHVHYFLSILNSKLMEFYFKKTTVPKAGGFYIYKTMFLKNLPIRTIDFTNPEDKSRHDKMVKLVDDMLKAKKELAGASMEQDIESLERHCAALDRQIDALVYELYGLTEEEIQIVEGKA